MNRREKPQTPELDPLGRARRHLRRASLEALEGAQALLEAGIGVGERTGAFSPESLPEEIKTALESWIQRLRDEKEFQIPLGWSQPLSEALEHEIARWEQRSQTDPDARPVLRAFLGFRELLWEFGVRRSDSTESNPSKKQDRQGDAPSSPRASERVQRFHVED